MKKRIAIPIIVLYLFSLMLMLSLSFGIPSVLLKNYEKDSRAKALIKTPIYHSNKELNCMTMAERLTHENQESPTAYAMFTWNGFGVRVTTHVVTDHTSPERVWDRWQDVVFGNAVQIFCGKLCLVEDILVCTAGTDDVHIVYYQTNKGNFVRIYPLEYILTATGQYEYIKNNAVYEMTEEEFQRVSIERAEYIDSGLEYSDTLEYFEEHNPELLQPPKFRIVQCYWIYRALAVLWISGGITAVVIYNKRKKRLAVESSAIDEPSTEA